MRTVDKTLGDDPDEQRTVPEGEHAARELLGTTLGAYRIERLLGEGAMGEVFLATHVALGRPVALKTLKPAVAADRALTERFFAEARAVNIIRHENIVECTDLVNDPAGRSYIVMELLEGTTLGGAIRDAVRIPPRRAARIVAQIADAIGAAHDKGIVHRDLKPENIYLIKRAGSSDYVKVLDFGIARLRPELGGASATQSGALIGTPAYMSPEQVRGEKVGPSADIYAVGVILFHMLTGRLPFEVASMSMMLVAQLQETPPRVDKLAPDVPRALADLVERALAKDAARRPADMAAFRRAVLEAAGLPADVTASLVDSSPAMPRASGSGASASGFEATLPPSAVGQSSISGSAAQVVAPGPRSKKPLFIGAGVVATAVIALVVVGPLASSSTSPPRPASSPPALETPPPPSPAPPPPAPVIDVEQQTFDAERRPDKLVEALAIGPGARVAEVGAASGLLTVHLTRAVTPGGKVLATDVDAAVLDQLAGRVERAGLADRVERRVVSAESPGLEAATYDAILVAEVDHYFGDPAAWLTTAKAALKPAGRLVISNRIPQRAKALAAAKRAGLELQSESPLTPTHYLAVFTAGTAKPVGATRPGNPPGGWACAPGTKAPGVKGCTCPAGYVGKRDNQGFAICAVATPNSDVQLRYACGPMGKMKPGVGCTCGEGYASKLQDGVHVCAPLAKPEPPKGDRTKTLVDPSAPKSP